MWLESGVRGCFRAPKRLCFLFLTLTIDCLSTSQPPYLSRAIGRSRPPSSVRNRAGCSVRNRSKSFSSRLLSWGLAVAHVLQAPCRKARKEDKAEGKRGGRVASMQAYRRGNFEREAM